MGIPPLFERQPDQVALTEVDTLVRNFVEADDPGSEGALEELLCTRAAPYVRRLVGQRLANAGVAERQDLDDSAAETAL